MVAWENLLSGSFLFHKRGKQVSKLSINLAKFIELSNHKFLMTTWLSPVIHFGSTFSSTSSKRIGSGFLIMQVVGAKCEAEEVTTTEKELRKYLICCRLTRIESNSNHWESCIIQTLSIPLNSKVIKYSNKPQYSSRHEAEYYFAKQVCMWDFLKKDAPKHISILIYSTLGEKNIIFNVQDYS